MTDPQREALAALRFNWSETPDHIWSTSPYHVDGLHERIEREIRHGIDDAAWSQGPSPIGLALQGQKGVGKTHLLGWVRREVQRQQSYFFLVALNSGDTFWADTVNAVLSGLLRPDDSGDSQLTGFLRRLCVRIGTHDAVTNAIAGDAPLSGDDLQVFMAGLRRLDPQVGRECADTARALVLYASTSTQNNAVGQDYLSGGGDPEDNSRQAWGIRPGAKQARKYGLGLLFATQAPKGLHNQITGNATTQFFGRLQHQTQIAAANDLARAKGGALEDIGGLGVGEFYLTSETGGFHRMRSPLCLSHHPPSPLRDEEVLDRARNG